MKTIILLILKGYKKIISPALLPIFGSACRFTPTCSQYTIESVEKYGVFKGLYLGTIRILKCNPFFQSY